MKKPRRKIDAVLKAKIALEALREAGFFSQEVRTMSTPDRRAMPDPDRRDLSIRGQCRLLGIARLGVYRPASANDAEDLALMRLMGIAALGPKPKTTKPARGHKISRTSCAT